MPLTTFWRAYLRTCSTKIKACRHSKYLALHGDPIMSSNSAYDLRERVPPVKFCPTPSLKKQSVYEHPAWESHYWHLHFVLRNTWVVRFGLCAFIDQSNQSERNKTNNWEFSEATYNPSVGLLDSLLCALMLPLDSIRLPFLDWEIEEVRTLVCLLDMATGSSLSSAENSALKTLQWIDIELFYRHSPSSCILQAA